MRAFAAIVRTDGLSPADIEQIFDAAIAEIMDRAARGSHAAVETSIREVAREVGPLGHETLVLQPFPC